MQQGEPLAPPVDALLLAGSCNYVRLVVLMAVLVAVFDEPPKMTLSGELTSVAMPVVAHQDH